MADKKPEKKELYILRHGTHDGFDEEGERKVFKAGEKVLLTAEQAEAFKDKFVSQQVHAAEIQHMQALASEGVDDGNKPAATQTKTQTPATTQTTAPATNKS